MEERVTKQFIIREFQPGDGETCFRIRAEAFIKLFYDEIGPDGVTAGINAYLPGEYEKMGYRKFGESECQYPDGPIRAVRLMKDLH